MAPDPREVRIDSHVEYNGDRCRVSYIAPMDKIYQFYLRRKDYPFDIHAHVFEVNPIPITEELLSELGFRKKMFDSDWSMWTKDVDSFFISVGIQKSECKGANIKDDNDEYAMCGWSYPCKYLHELESFYYHCTKQELIND